jgi:hypothetical protein
MATFAPKLPPAAGSFQPPQQRNRLGSPPGFPPVAMNTQNYLDTFFQANERSMAQFKQLLSQYGAPLRGLILQSSPELAQTQKYLQESFANPIPETLAQNYRQHIRQAQVARGFEGGESTSQAEALQLTLLAEQRRKELLPQLQQFGAGILGMTGFQSPSFGDIASLAQTQAQTQLGFSELQQRQYQFQQQQSFAQLQFEEGLRREQEQSDFARQQYFLNQQQVQDMIKESKKKTYLDLIEEDRTQNYVNRKGAYNTTGVGAGIFDQRGFNVNGSMRGFAF